MSSPSSFASTAAPSVVRLAALLGALETDSRRVGDTDLVLPAEAGKYRSAECAFVGRVRAVTIITPRLTFLSLQDPALEATNAAASAASRLTHVIMKQNDGTGWSATQQSIAITRLRVGDLVDVHAFLEMNPVVATPSEVAATATAAADMVWNERTATAAPAQNDAAADSSRTSLPPLEARITLHAISIGFPSDGLRNDGDQRCAHVIAHSSAFAAAVASAQTAASSSPADPAAAPQDADVAPSDAPTYLPDLVAGAREEIARLAAVAAQAEAVRLKYEKLSSSGSEKEARKKANRERPQGEAKKRMPKCNVNRGLKFCDFLVSTFGFDLLSRDGGVLDVAGGQGALSFQLSKRDLPCCLVDPREVGGGAWAARREAYIAIRSKLAADGARPMPTFRHARKLFNEAFTTDEDSAPLWAATSLVVGMHPDEATEDLVRLSLRDGKPFAVVPCCVFPNMYANRRNKAGEHVKTHEQLCQYYMELDPTIGRAELPFEGRNTVIFWLGRRDQTLTTQTSQLETTEASDEGAQR